MRDEAGGGQGAGQGTGTGPVVQGTEPEHDAARATRTLVVGPYAPRRAAAGERSVAARLDEAVGLAAAIDLDVRGAEAVNLSAPRPSTLFGKGKVEEIKARVEAEGIGLVVVDGALSPVQQRNLEREWGAKVLDRTGLILEIFGRRARTKEGALQVELAHLAYQKSRLVRSWTHLERQRGGFGFLGGPGETQIEADRRIISERIARIEKDLEQVRRTRGLHRAGRERVPYPTVALVGYTNAGKSTLFNRLTRADVLAKDLLFATLDPTARVVRLAHGLRVVLIDTVGFISDLPTTLVEAFRATLEDVTGADVVLHVRDLAHEDAEAQGADVAAILADLGVGQGAGEGPGAAPPGPAGGAPPAPRVLEAWNKIDLVGPEERERLVNAAARRPPAERPVLLSAATGEGCDALLAAIEARLAAGRGVWRVTLEPGDGAGLAWLHEAVEVLETRHDEEGRVTAVARAGEAARDRLLRRFPGAKRVR